MNFCDECGNKLEANANECTKCGKKFNVNYKSDNGIGKGMATASIILGIIGIIGAIIINIFILPLAIIGLVLGIVYKINTDKSFKSGIILNIISIVISILMIIFWIVLMKRNVDIKSLDNFFNKAETYIEKYEITTNIENKIINYKWINNNGKSLYLYDNNEFVLYEDDNNHNNYYKGNYLLETAEEAVEYIDTKFSNDNFDSVRQYKNIFDGDKSYYKLENYLVLILNYEDNNVSSNSNNIEKISSYYGFFDNISNQLDITDINTKSKEILIKKDKII